VLQEIVEIEINLYKGEMRFCFKQVVVGKQSPKRISLKTFANYFSISFKEEFEYSPSEIKKINPLNII
jgi:hypothetical protein